MLRCLCRLWLKAVPSRSITMIDSMKLHKCNLLIPCLYWHSQHQMLPGLESSGTWAMTASVVRGLLCDDALQ